MGCMSAYTAIDHAHMAEALRLAERGLFTTQPNPRVGCVIAQGPSIVGRGWHERAGEPHAEVHAIRQAGAAARGGTAYVTLEPCAHHGRTPPCADALIAAGVARVIAAIEDPFPQVDGAGMDRLRAAGIHVASGLMREEAREINRGFFSRIERGRPWLRLKLASSLDGRTALADGRSWWITGEAARKDVARWRARSSALLVGAGTIRTDNPRLTARLAPDESTFIAPLRVVLDTRLEALPADAHVLSSDAPTLVLHARDAHPAHSGYERVESMAVPTVDGRLDLGAVLSLLAERGCNELQVESGATLSGALLDAGLVDELLLYIAPVLLGDQARPLMRMLSPSSMDSRRSLRIIDRRMLGDDVRLLLRTS